MKQELKCIVSSQVVGKCNKIGYYNLNGNPKLK